MKFAIPEYYNQSKPTCDKEEMLFDIKCYVCSKVVKMTRFQRFCKNCRSHVNKRYGYM